jgi:hypothetical protein
MPCQLPSVVVSAGATNVADVPAVPEAGGFRVTVAVPLASPSAAVAVIVTVVATVTVTGAAYKPVLDSVPCAAPLGVTLLIVHAGVPVPLVTVAVNCCVPPPTKLLLLGLTVTVSVPVVPLPVVGAKKIPLTTALLEVAVTVNFTLPEMSQTKYTPFAKPEMLRLSSTTPLTASLT